MREVAKTNREAIMKIDVAGSPEYVIAQVNEALKEYGGYIQAYLQFVEVGRNTITSSIEYRMQIVREEKK